MKKRKPGDGYLFRPITSDGFTIYILRDKRGSKINNFIILPNGDNWKFFTCNGDQLVNNEIDPMWAIFLGRHAKIQTYNDEVAESGVHKQLKIKD